MTTQARTIVISCLITSAVIGIQILGRSESPAHQNYESVVKACPHCNSLESAYINWQQTEEAVTVRSPEQTAAMTALHLGNNHADAFYMPRSKLCCALEAMGMRLSK